jgi:hypothetical protein
MNKNKNRQLQELQQILQKIQKQIAQAQRLLQEILSPIKIKTAIQSIKNEADHDAITQDSQINETEPFHVEKYPTGEEVIEGVFNGFAMIGPSGREYQIPENYVSKSKLVEGDLLKLTITPQGRFIYKQIGPVERETKRGALLYKETEDQYCVLADGLEYKILRASVTYYQGKHGDEVVILLPRGRTAIWAALDNVVKALPESEEIKDTDKLETDEQMGKKEVEKLEEI